MPKSSKSRKSSESSNSSNSSKSSKSSESSNSRLRSIKKVSCPECGDLFQPRGIAAHRRFKHSLGALMGAGLGKTEVRVRGSLDAICRALDRLDTRLDRLEHVGHGTAVKDSQLGALNSELGTLLAEITAVQTEHDDVEGLEEEARIRRRECHQELGRLRLRQARLLFLMGPEAPGADPESKVTGLELL
ncbi:MAG: hypothetical protein V3T22_09785 [Planctomycetota bacterium]